MNDELQGTNQQLRERTQEVGELNAFMDSVLMGLHAGVVVVDRDLRVTAWNARAEDLWGLRADEAVDQHLLNLDIGLPVIELTPALRRALRGDGVDGDGAGPRGRTTPGVSVDLPAINRRGRSITVGVVITPLQRTEGEVTGAILVMDDGSAPPVAMPSPGGDRCWSH
ncbi:MAG: PAS domain-containing protein [Actinomycetales bacterium]